MTKLPVIHLIIALLLIAVSSPGFGSSYITVSAGNAAPVKIYDETRYDFARFDFGNGINTAIAIGKRHELFSLELELSHRELESEELYNGAVGVEPMSGHAAQTGLLLNAYYRFFSKNVISAAINFGIGRTRIEWKNVSSPTFNAINDSNDVTSYKAGITLDATINNDYSILVEYARLFLDDLVIKDGNGDKGTLNNQDINVFAIGLKYTF